MKTKQQQQQKLTKNNVVLHQSMITSVWDHRNRPTQRSRILKRCLPLRCTVPTRGSPNSGWLRDTQPNTTRPIQTTRSTRSITISSQSTCVISFSNRTNFFFCQSKYQCPSAETRTKQQRDTAKSLFKNNSNFAFALVVDLVEPFMMDNTAATAATEFNWNCSRSADVTRLVAGLWLKLQKKKKTKKAKKTKNKKESEQKNNDSKQIRRKNRERSHKSGQSVFSSRSRNYDATFCEFYATDLKCCRNAESIAEICAVVVVVCVADASRRQCLVSGTAMPSFSLIWNTCLGLFCILSWVFFRVFSSHRCRSRLRRRHRPRRRTRHAIYCGQFAINVSCNQTFHASN